MKVFYSASHQSHSPPFEILDGGEKTQSYEIPLRAVNVLTSLSQTPWAEIIQPGDLGLNPILEVHDAGYLDFLQTAFELWTREDANYEHLALTPATFPPGGMRRLPKSILGKAGFYMMDLSAPIGAGTCKAALDSANSALSGADVLLSGEKSAFALCRPPGHHAGKANCGGYCYLNNSAIAANWLSHKGKVAVLDIDYHAGNGTQDIFYDRSDVLTISLHADPAYEYPYYAGYSDETGSGDGLGYHKNYPLPYGTADDTYLDTLRQALAAIREFSPRFLVLSAGMDISQDDPIGKFQITHDGIGRIGNAISLEGYPTLVVMEGGYNLAGLGADVVTLLENF